MENHASIPAGRLTLLQKLGSHLLHNIKVIIFISWSSYPSSLGPSLGATLHHLHHPCDIAFSCLNLFLETSCFLDLYYYLFCHNFRLPPEIFLLSIREELSIKQLTNTKNTEFCKIISLPIMPFTILLGAYRIFVIFRRFFILSLCKHTSWFPGGPWLRKDKGKKV